MRVITQPPLVPGRMAVDYATCTNKQCPLCDVTLKVGAHIHLTFAEVAAYKAQQRREAQP
jgi:hypothetical protein